MPSRRVSPKLHRRRNNAEKKNILGETTPEKLYFAVRWIDSGLSQYLPPSFRTEEKHRNRDNNECLHNLCIFRSNQCKKCITARYGMMYFHL
jgi:hypothetical protein